MKALAVALVLAIATSAAPAVVAAPSTSAAPSHAPSVTTAQVASLRIGSGRLPGAVRSAAYRARVSAVGGRAPLRWSVAAGALPGGLRLSSTGVVSGVPVASGARRLNLRVVDARGAVATRSVEIAVVPRGGILLDSRSIGSVRMGSSPSVVMKSLQGLLGTPTSVRTSVACGPVTLPSYIATWGDFRIEGISVNGEPVRIKTWAIDGPRLFAAIRARDGIGVGSTFKALRATYPRATVDDEEMYPDLLVESGSGAWFVGANQRVTAIEEGAHLCW